MAINLGEFDYGDVIRVEATFTDPTNDHEPFDPTEVFATVREPDGTLLEYDGEYDDLINDSVGHYYIDVPSEQAGKWYCRIFSTGVGQAAKEAYWTIKAAVAVEGGAPTPTRTISFCAVDADGELVVFDPEYDVLPSLAAPSGGYGVKRIDAPSIIAVENGEEMTLADGHDALYEYSFEEVLSEEDPTPIASRRYRFYVQVTINDTEWHVPSSTALADSAMLAVGRYTDSYLIGQRYGQDNMHQWLGHMFQGSEEPVDYALRAWRFIRDAEDALDDMLAGPFVSGAFVIDEDYEEIPRIVVRMATELAGLMMYEARGVDDINPDTNEPHHRLRYVKQELKMLARRIQLGLTTLSGSASLTPTRTPSAGGWTVPSVSDYADDIE